MLNKFLAACFTCLMTVMIIVMMMIVIKTSCGFGKVSVHVIIQFKRLLSSTVSESLRH
jgi:hypothetical protein